MTRLAKTIATALPAALLLASSASAAAPHSAQGSGGSHDVLAIVVVALLGVVLAVSALVPLRSTRTGAPSTR